MLYTDAMELLVLLIAIPATILAIFLFACIDERWPDPPREPEPLPWPERYYGPHASRVLRNRLDVERDKQLSLRGY